MTPRARDAGTPPVTRSVTPSETEQSSHLFVPFVMRLEKRPIYDAQLLGPRPLLSVRFAVPDACVDREGLRESDRAGG